MFSHNSMQGNGNDLHEKNHQLLPPLTADAQTLFDFIQQLYPSLDHIPLHVPKLGELEKSALIECIDSQFVSSVGSRIGDFEQALSSRLNDAHVVALVNGTSALQLALRTVGVRPGEEVITPSLTFIATANAVAHCGCEPVFIDIEPDSLGMCPHALRSWLQEHAVVEEGQCFNRHSESPIGACICVHIFGHSCQLAELKMVCNEFCLPLIEDAAEAFGSKYFNSAVGSLSDCGILSFNGNKIITTGGGGALVTTNRDLAERARHLATTAKMPDTIESQHDDVGFNFRMPNINAALGCAQLSRFEKMLAAKRKIAAEYETFFSFTKWRFIKEPRDSESNYWLNAIVCESEAERDYLIVHARQRNIELRAAWQLLSESHVYGECQRGDLRNTLAIAPRLLCLPSAVVGSRYE